MGVNNNDDDDDGYDRVDGVMKWLWDLFIQDLNQIQTERKLNPHQRERKTGQVE